MTRLPSQPNLSLINGLAVLQVVVTAEGPVGSRDVARRMNIEHTKVSRLLGTLAYLGMVRQTSGRKYLPGPGIHLLSAQSLRGSGLLAATLPHLQGLRGGDATVSLAVLWEHEVCYLLYAIPGRSVEQSIGAHSPYPAQESIHGLALLAHVNDEGIRGRLAQGPQLLDPARFQSFLAEIHQTRQRGYALRTLPDGRISLAATIGEPPIASISVLGRFEPSQVEGLTATLLKVAGKITQALSA